MPKSLTDEQEQQLLVEYSDGWTINEISVMFKISHRTVYRTLERHKVRIKYNGGPKRKRKSRAKRKPLQPCGTNAAYQRHRRAKEYPCDPCLRAHAADVEAAKQKRKAKRK